MKLPVQKHHWVSALRSYVRQRLLGPKVLGALYETRNGLIACPTYDDVFARAFADEGGWDDAALAELLALIGPTSRVLVVGAHLGLLAIPLAKRAREVVAVEANPDTFRLLQVNLLLNRCDNVRALQCAAGEKAGSIEFLLSRANSGGSKRMPKHRDWIYRYDLPETVRVELVALDEALRGESFDLVVMDIEGSEYFALQGMPRLLASCRHLQIEYLPHHVERVAGVDDAALLALLAPHFASARISGDAGFGAVPRERFGALVAEVRRRGAGDLLFSK